jgi:hypothetical protein
MADERLHSFWLQTCFNPARDGEMAEGVPFESRRRRRISVWIRCAQFGQLSEQRVELVLQHMAVSLVAAA